MIPEMPCSTDPAMRQLDLFAALQSSTKGIDTQFESAHVGDIK